MIRFGRTAQQAVATILCLAKLESHERRRYSSREVSKQSGLSVPTTAKLLSTMSRASIIDGKAGPGGGFRLARALDQISVLEIVAQTERLDYQLPFPMGKDVSPESPARDAHRWLKDFSNRLEDQFRETTLDMVLQTSEC